MFFRHACVRTTRLPDVDIAYNESNHPKLRQLRKFSAEFYTRSVLTILGLKITWREFKMAEGTLDKMAETFPWWDKFISLNFHAVNPPHPRPVNFFYWPGLPRRKFKRYLVLWNLSESISRFVTYIDVELIMNVPRNGGSVISAGSRRYGPMQLNRKLSKRLPVNS